MELYLLTEKIGLQNSRVKKKCREKMNAIVPFERVELKKSNFLISAKYKSSLLENKVLAVSLTKVTKDEAGHLVSIVKASELKKMLKKSNGSFYDQLRECADGLSNRQIVMEDRENNRFRIINVVQTADYENGDFKIKYNDDLEKYLYNLQQNFTRLNLRLMTSFKSVYSFRLYELLKSRAYYPKDVKSGDNLFRITYNLAELKLDLGAVNSSYDRVQKILRAESPNYEKAVEVAKEKTFERWCDFKARVLDVAVKEINSSELSDMHIEYELMKSGRGGKVYEIAFIVHTPVRDILDRPPVEQIVNKESLLEELDELLQDEDIRLREMKILLEDAKYDIEKIRNAYNIYKNQSGIINFVGWMRDAIQKDYKTTKSVETDVKKGGFNEFKRDYDFVELEKKLLEK